MGFYFLLNVILVCKLRVFFNRWRIVIHGGIDGFSRIPVYLKASNNNKASTVLSCFREAVSEYGLPSWVHSDKGGENVDVATLAICMLTHIQQGPGKGSWEQVQSNESLFLWLDYEYIVPINFFLRESRAHFSLSLHLSFFVWDDFYACSCFTRSTIPEESWGLLVIYLSLARWPFLGL